MNSIRFIVETYSSAFNRNGNRTHCACITSTKTGKDLQLKDVGGQRNAPGLIRNLLKLDWAAVHCVEVEDIPLRQFSHNPAHRNGMYEHQVTAEMIAELETVAGNNSAPATREFLESMARMETASEIDERDIEGMDGDDACATLSACIESARELLKGGQS